MWQDRGPPAPRGAARRRGGRAGGVQGLGIAVQGLEAAKLRVEVIVHLQDLAATFEEGADLRVRMMLGPIPVVVIVHHPAVSPASHFDRHLIVGTPLVGQRDARGFFHAFAHCLDVCGYTLHLVHAIRRAVQRSPILEDDADDFQAEPGCKVADTSAHTLPVEHRTNMQHTVLQDSLAIRGPDIVEVDNHTRHFVWPTLRLPILWRLASSTPWL
mmetsp:Transcript_8352/g.23050  ORF Transcript_8352/g.23050 Transcript_8352/m.23050 type:complete len:214 (+) Transcript_8352:663-1304(+)